MVLDQSALNVIGSSGAKSPEKKWGAGGDLILKPMARKGQRRGCNGRMASSRPKNKVSADHGRRRDKDKPFGWRIDVRLFK